MMIICFRPPGFRRDWFSRYCHVWKRQAGLAKEALVQCELTDDNLAHYWDRVNTTPGRAVIWTDPSFIPHPSFFDELDYYLNEKKRIVALQDYDGVFQPRADVPSVWEPVGVAQFPLIFQLAGQAHLQLPVYAALCQGPWHWLGLSERRSVILVEQYFVGNREVPLKRSNLGISCPRFWGSGECRSEGQLIFGTDRHVQRTALQADWLERLAAWESWQNYKTDPNTTYFTQSFASDGQDA